MLSRSRRPQTEPDHAATPQAEGLLDLQPAGNAAVAQQLGATNACQDALAEADRWAAAGPYGPEDVIGAGGRGGFSATYDANGGAGILEIAQGVAIELKDTLVDSGGTVAQHPDLPVSSDLVTIAAGINALSDPDRSAALAEFQWAADERDTWISELETLVETSWGGQHTFFLNQPQWQWIGAVVDVDLDVGERAQGPDDHMSVESYRVPEGQSLRSYTDDSTGRGISHNVGRGSSTDARDQTMRLASTTIGPKEYDLLKKTIEFDHDSAALTGAAESRLRRFISTFEGAPGDPRHQEISVELIAHCSSSGTAVYNRNLAERRAAAVRQFLTDNGFSQVDSRVVSDIRGEAGADQDSDNAADRKVELVVDGGARMVTANHEWGHALGLGDEYGTVGADAGHDALVQDMTRADGTNLPGAVKEHNGGIMSYGNEVRPHHYATFHKGLEDVTDKEPWSLGNRRRRADVESECGGS